MSRGHLHKQVDEAGHIVPFALRAITVALLLAWSVPASAQVGTPSPASPADGATGQSTSVTISWGGVSLATSYELQVATDNSFSNVVVDQTQSGTSYTASGLSQGTTYYWRVRASTLLLTSSWSSTWSFSTASGTPSPSAPSLASPTDGSTGLSTTPTLSWNASSGAASYNIEVATDNTFSSIVVSNTGIGGTSQQVSGLSGGTTYYWRVQAVNSTGASSWSTVWSFATQTTSAPPGSPSLASPSNGSTGEPTSIVLSWSASSGATKYWLQVATDQSFTSIVYGDSTITSTSEQVNYLSTSTTYYWRVKAMDQAGSSSWSSVWSFTTATAQVQPPSAPTLASPSDGASGQPTTLTLTWNAVSNSGHYNIQVATDLTFSNIVYSNYTLIGTSTEVSGLSQNTEYYWHVSASNTGGQSSWSSTWTFATSTAALPSAPQPLSPSNGATNLGDSLTFVWRSASGASEYDLQVALSSSFSTLTINDSSLTDTSLYVTTLAPGNEYFWRVAAKSSAGTGSWSGTLTFTTKSQVVAPSVPELVSPPNGATSTRTTDTLTWNPSRNAEYYRLQVALSSDFLSFVADDSDLSGTSFILSGLSSGSTYFWRVEAVNTAGVSGWSSPWTFTTGAPPATPTLMYPANGATNQPVNDTLRWAPSTHANSYEVAFSTYPSLDSNVVQDSTSAADYLVVNSLNSGTHYYWKVRAVNSFGVGAWSSKWEFTTLIPSTVPSTPVLVSPANGATNQPLIETLTWKTSDNAQEYRVEVSTSSSLASSILMDTTLAKSYVNTIALSAGVTYWWRVDALDTVGPSQWSQVWSFTTSGAQKSGPTLSVPANGTTGLPTSVVLSWNNIQGATQFNVQVALDSSFSTFVTNDSTVTSTSLTIDSLATATSYYWHVRAKLDSGTWTAFSGAWEFSTVREVSPGRVGVAVDVGFPKSSDTSGFSALDYRLVGLPGASNLSVTSVLRGTPGVSWEAYWDNGDPSNYFVKFNQANDDSMFHFYLGRAFWIIHVGPLVVDTSVAAAPLDSSGSVYIPLHAGWNLITDPLPDSVAWGAVQVANSTAEPLYGFNGAFQISPELQPGEGYYFFNSTGLRRLSIPSPGSQTATSSTERWENQLASAGWTVNISLTSGKVTDDAAWIGVSSSVQSDHNPLDVHKPTAIGNVPATYFHHPDWNRQYSNYASDIHPDFTDISQWALTVDSAPFMNAKLRFSGLDRVPSWFDVYLFNPVSKSWSNLRRAPELAFTPVSKTTTFNILVGKGSLIKDKIRQNGPSTFYLGQNYPNPFNPSTMIPLYMSGDAHVEITVFNVIGQEVARVFDGSLKAGNHSFLWDGRDEHGQELPSGVYFYRATTSAGASVVHKMVLLK